MSVHNNGAAANRVRSLALAGVSSDDTVLISVWVKRNGNALNSVNTAMIVCGATADEDPMLAVTVDGTGMSRAKNQAFSTGGSLPPVPQDTWTNLIGVYGPWNNTSQTLAHYRDGVLAHSLNTQRAFPAIAMTSVCFTGGVGGGSVNTWKGRVAEAAVYINPGASLAAIIADLQVKAVHELAHAPVHAWRLLGDGTPAAGGITLSAVGTPVWDAEDHPTFSAPPPVAAVRPRGGLILC